MPRILLADDHSVVRRHVREMLETEPGFAVCAEASTGIEAVTLTASELPDIVILDLSMPQLNGLEAARQIHERFPSIDMLLLTMYDPIELMDEVIASGVRTCILKTDLHDLLATVRSIWNQRQTCDMLTEMERQIVQMLAQAKSNKEIAATLSLTVRAVEIYRAVIMHKLKVSSNLDLVHYATRQKSVETKSPIKPFVSSLR